MKKLLILILVFMPVLLKAQEVPTDVIVTATGDEISALITEVTSDVIKYNKPTMPTGPVFTMSKGEVLMIKYRDGSKEVVATTNPVQAQTQNKVNPSASALVSQSAVALDPQVKTVRFQGYINAMANLCFAGIYTPALDLSFGFKASNYFYAGLQTGLGFACSDGLKFLTIPLGVDLKGLIPVGAKTSLFLGFDVGAEFLIIGSGAGVTCYVGPSFGIETGRFVASIGYQAWTDNGIALHNLNLKIGVRLGK